MSLAAALDAALQHGLAAETARLERAQGRQALAEGISAALPSFSASYVSSGATFGELGDTWRSSFGLTQPVVDATVYFDILGGVRGRRVGRAEAAQTLADLVFKVQTRYYDLAKAQALVASADKEYARATANLAVVDAKYQLKEASRSDQLQAEADALGKETDLSSARDQVKLNQRELCDLMGYGAWEEVAAEDLPPPEPPSELPATVVSAAALARNPDLAVLEAKWKQADAARWAAWAGILPALSFSLSHGSTIGTTNLPGLEPTGTRYGLVLSFPVVDVARRTLDVTGADLDRRQANIAARQGRIDARQRLANLLATQDLSYQRWESAAKTVELNEEAYRLQARSYELGAASMADVLQVGANLADAERALVEANAAYWAGRAELNYVLGVSWEKE